VVSGVRAIALIPVLPLLGAAVNGILGRRLPRRLVGILACATVLGAFVLAVKAVVELAALPEGARYLQTSLGTWLPLGEVAGNVLTVDWSFALDPISAVMVLVVTGVGFLIHVYSLGYMAHEEGFSRFFTYLNLFMAMMLTLVLGDNLLVMFVGWEGVGLCSYLLIGFFYDRPFDLRTGLTCADAGRKAFITNRIGDFAFLVGMILLAVRYGTFRFPEIAQAVSGGGEHALLVVVGILLFLGACGKSAQIPLYVWLPDAMAGPTPVSALIHAATMVTAGVYMVTRMSALYAGAPEAMALVAVVGAATSLFAATMGITATDIKKVLAYSTVSQLGYMFAAAGWGPTWPGCSTSPPTLSSRRCSSWGREASSMVSPAPRTSVRWAACAAPCPSRSPPSWWDAWPSPASPGSRASSPRTRSSGPPGPRGTWASSRCSRCRRG
jgi:NADH-quinone oxidoreductase subunit L